MYKGIKIIMSIFSKKQIKDVNDTSTGNRWGGSTKKASSRGRKLMRLLPLIKLTVNHLRELHDEMEAEMNNTDSLGDTYTYSDSIYSNHVRNDPAYKALKKIFNECEREIAIKEVDEKYK